jgi:hypothetical protein
MEIIKKRFLSILLVSICLGVLSACHPAKGDGKSVGVIIGKDAA